MDHVNKVIEATQKAHDEELKLAEAEFEQKKIDLADKHVKSIIGKFM